MVKRPRASSIENTRCEANRPSPELENVDNEVSDEVSTCPCGGFSDESSNSDIDLSLDNLHVLVIGAGGLGCEILKNLAQLGFVYIDVVDMDIVELTNLNRQFLFTKKDIGRSKAEVAAEAVKRRVPKVQIVPHFCSIQDLPDSFYRKFQIIVCGLDSVAARRWINAKVVELVDIEDPKSLRPLLDGGTEGLRGQARVILPGLTACYECSLSMIPKTTSYPLCTIASTPRLPEHCIEWASIVSWPKNFNHEPNWDRDGDVRWVYEKAAERAAEFGIDGVTLQLTQGVVKRIIPAVASTNAIIAAVLCNEAVKIATGCAPFLQNYFMFNGTVGAYGYSFQLERRNDCPVCGIETLSLSVPGSLLLSDFLNALENNPALLSKNPSLATATKTLYMQKPPHLEKQTRPNLERKLKELFPSGTEVALTDSELPFQLLLQINFNDDA